MSTSGVMIDDSASSDSDMECYPVSSLFDVEHAASDSSASDDDVEMNGTGTPSDPIKFGEGASSTKRKSNSKHEEKAAKRRKEKAREKARRTALQEKENSLQNLRSLSEGSMPPSTYLIKKLILCLSPDVEYRNKLHDHYTEHLLKFEKAWKDYSDKVRSFMLTEVWADGTAKSNTIKKNVRPLIKNWLFLSGGNIKKWGNDEILIRTLSHISCSHNRTFYKDLGTCTMGQSISARDFTSYMGSTDDISDANWKRITDLFDELLANLWLDEEKKMVPPSTGSRMFKGPHGRYQFKFPQEDCDYWNKCKTNTSKGVHPSESKNEKLDEAFCFMKTMALMDFLSRRDITMVNLYDESVKHTIVKGDLHLQFRHPKMLMHYNLRGTVMSATHISQYGYIDKWSGSKRWPFKFSVAIEKHLEHLFQLCFMMNVWDKKDFRNILEKKFDAQWRKKCTLTYTFYNDYRFAKDKSDLVLSGLDDDGKGDNRLKLKSEEEQQTSFRYSKKIVECLSRLSLLSRWLDDYWEKDDPVHQFESVHLHVEQLRAMCVMSAKLLQSPFITTNRLLHSSGGLGIDDKLDYIDHVEYELGNDYTELYYFDKALSYYVGQLDEVKKNSPDTYDILCDTKYFDTELDSGRTILDYHPRKFSCENWFVPMIRVYGALISIFVRIPRDPDNLSKDINRLEKNVGIFNEYFPSVNYPMELEYEMGVPAFQAYKTLFMVFGHVRKMAIYYRDISKYLHKNVILSKKHINEKYEKLNRIFIVTNCMHVGLLWSPSIYVWYNSLRYSRVSYTGTLDSYTERYNSHHVENSTESSKKLDYSKPMSMAFIDPCTRTGYSLIPMTEKQSARPFERYLKSLADMLTMKQSSEAVRNAYLNNTRKKFGNDMSFEEAELVLFDSGVLKDLLLGFIKSLIHCMDATTRYVIDKYHVKGGGSVGFRGSLNIGPRAADDDDWKPPMEKVLELIKVDRMIQLSVNVFSTSKSYLMTHSPYPITVFFEEIWSSEKHRDDLVSFMRAMAEKWKDWRDFENLDRYPERFSTTINELMKMIKKCEIKKSLFQKKPFLQQIREFHFMQSMSTKVEHHALVWCTGHKATISQQMCSQSDIPWAASVGLFKKQSLDDISKCHRLLCGKLLNVIDPSYEGKVDSLNGGFCNICMQGVKIRHFWMCDNCGDGIVCLKCAKTMENKGSCPYCKSSNTFFADIPQQKTVPREEHLEVTTRYDNIIERVKNVGIRPYPKSNYNTDLSSTVELDTMVCLFPQRLLTIYAMFISGNKPEFVRNLYRFTDASYGNMLDDWEEDYGYIIKNICLKTNGCNISDIKEMIRETTMHLRSDEEDHINDLQLIKESINIKTQSYTLDDQREARTTVAMPSKGSVWAMKQNPEQQILIRDIEDFEKIVDADKGLSEGYKIYYYDQLFFPYRKMQTVRYNYTVSANGTTIEAQKFAPFHSEWMVVSKLGSDKKNHVWHPVLTNDENQCLNQLFRRTVLNWGEVIKMCEVNRSEGGTLAKSLLEYGPNAPPNCSISKDVVGVYCRKPDDKENTFKTIDPKKYNKFDMPLYNILRQEAAFNLHAWSADNTICPMFLHNLTRVHNDYTDFKKFQDDHYFIFSDSPLKILEEFVRKKDGLPLTCEIRFYIMGTYRENNYKEAPVLLDGTLRDMEAQFSVAGNMRVTAKHHISSIVSQYKAYVSAINTCSLAKPWENMSRQWSDRGDWNAVTGRLVNCLRKRQQFFFVPIGYTVNNLYSPSMNKKITSLEKNELIYVQKHGFSREQVVRVLNDVEKIDEGKINVKKLTMKQEKSYTIEHRNTICVDGKTIEDNTQYVLEKSDLLCIFYYSFKQDPTKPNVSDADQDLDMIGKWEHFMLKNFDSVYDPSIHNIKLCKIKCDHIREAEYGMEVAMIGFMLFDVVLGGQLAVGHGSWIFNKLLHEFWYFDNVAKIYKGDEEWTKRDGDSYAMVNGHEICIKDDKRLASDGIIADSFTFMERKIYQNPLIKINQSNIKRKVNHNLIPKSLRKESKKMTDLIGKKLAITTKSKMFKTFLFAHHVVHGGFETNAKFCDAKVPVSSTGSIVPPRELCNNEAERIQWSSKRAYDCFNWDDFSLRAVDVDMGFRYFLSDNRHSIDSAAGSDGIMMLTSESDSKTYPVLDNISQRLRKAGTANVRQWFRLCVAPPFEKDKLYMNDIIFELRSSKWANTQGNEDVILLVRMSIEDFLIYFTEKDNNTNYDEDEF